uniref:Polyprotein protein, putative n=1 Tax=Solanum tuberosum TaxID=4113 RepID=Q0KIJ0_SOLTU|nr:polyprotein protein, putative [Solanum tuberosum]
MRFEACEQGRGDSATVTTLKADIIGMRKDVDELKSTDLSMLFSTVEIPDISSTDVPPSSEIPPATTTGDVAMVTVDAEFEAEIDEKELGVRDEAMYNDLADFEGAMIYEAKDANEPGIDAPTDGITDIQSSPQA